MESWVRSVIWKHRKHIWLTMSTFTDTKKKWADADSDSSDEEDNEEQVEVAQVEEPVVEATKDDSSDSESESDEDDTEPLNLAKATISPVEVKKVDVKLLSKKERQALKKQELDDLDSILAAFGPVEVAPVANDSAPVSVPVSTDATDTDKKKKTKKKKVAAKKEDAAPAAVEATEEEVVVVKDINAVLKNRVSKKGPTKGANVSDAQKIALAEAKAVAAESKKKNRDKSKFCEGTY